MSIPFGRLAGIAAFFLGAVMAIEVARAEESGPLYELRTYTTHEGRLPALNARFRNHTMKLFEKHGMKNVMYWTPTDPKLASNTLIYVLEHKSEEAAKASWAGFRADPEWAKVRDESEKDGKIVLKVEFVYMRTTDFSPKAK